jgi:hypothetical protein
MAGTLKDLQEQRAIVLQDIKQVMTNLLNTIKKRKYLMKMLIIRKQK